MTKLRLQHQQGRSSPPSTMAISGSVGGGGMGTINKGSGRGGGGGNGSALAHERIDWRQSTLGDQQQHHHHHRGMGEEPPAPFRYREGVREAKSVLLLLNARRGPC